MSEEKFRYRVGFSKEERLVLSILVVIYMIAVLWFCATGFDKVTTDVINVFIVAELLGVIALAGIYSYVGIYKGKCVYNKIFWKNEYRISDFGEPETDWMLFYNGHFRKTMVYVFYDVNGKKIFHLSTSYENAEKFYKEMKRHYFQGRREVREREKKNKKRSSRGQNEI